MAIFVTASLAGLRIIYQIEPLRDDFEQDQIATISFGQSVPINEMRRAKRETLLADLFIAIGSSLTVYPAAGFPRLAKCNGATLVISIDKNGA